MGFREIDAAQKEGQFLGSELHGWSIRGRPCEGAGLEALGAEPPSIAIPEEDLEAVAAGVGEDEEMAREGIELEGVPDHPGEGVEGFAEVGGTGGEEDAGVAEEAQHRRRMSMSWESWRGSMAMGKARRQPVGDTNSPEGPFVGGSVA